MSDELTSTALRLLLGTSGLSLAALFYLFQKHIDGRSLLAYQPRRRVPWGTGVALFAMFIPLLGVVGFLVSGDPGVEELASEVPSTESAVAMGWGNFAFMVSFVVVVAVWLTNFFQADAHDLGLPTSWQQLRQDVGLGIFATLAAFVPIYAVQLILINALGNDTPHPLVKEIAENQSPAMLIVGFAMAVIGAPLFEEFTFRALLQGWLERREDEIVGFSATIRPSQHESSIVTLDENGMVVTEQEPSFPPQKEIGNEDFEFANVHQANVHQERPKVMVVEPAPPDHPPRGLISALPHGWTPILISAVAFGMAHLGHGVAPISLVLFGMVLGYLYQRTHRLAPCITAHMVFNAHSMVLLWLQLGEPSAT